LSISAPTTPNAVSAEVEFVEPLGQTTNLHLQAQGSRFVLVTGRTTVEAGATIGVVAAPEHVRVVEASRSARAKD
jgi:multiple sugar transport system ATP-binding protein